MMSPTEMWGFFYTFPTSNLTLMKTKTTLLLLFAAMLFSNAIFAQDGANDPTFNPGDTEYTNTGTDGEIFKMAQQQDGKIIIVGNFHNYRNSNRNYIARLNEDETLDMNFNPGSGADASIRAVKILPNGKIFIGGDFSLYNGVSRKGIALLNADGSVDTSFDPGIGFNDFVQEIAIQSDNKIIVAGGFTTYNSTTADGIIRLNPDGSIDTAFSSVGNNGIINALVIQPDGKIIAAGTFTSFSGLSKGRITRLNSDGSNDASFSIGSGADDNVFTLVTQSDGKILVGGMFYNFNTQPVTPLVRLNPDGTRDMSFTPVIDTSVFGIAIDGNNKILIGGYGVVDGWSFFARLNNNGTVDTSFMAQPGYPVNSMVVMEDNKVLIGGNFLSLNNIARNHLATINPDGSLVTSFTGVATGADDKIKSADLQTDGKIIIAGDFTHYNGVEKISIARLSEDGIPDASFDPGTGANGTISRTLIQPDGKIIIAGRFTEYDGHSAHNIARIDSNGNFDETFVTGEGISFLYPTSRIYDMVLQNDGKILLGSEINGYNGTSLNSTVIRINPDGSLDTGFLANETRMPVKIIVQPDNKILVGFGDGWASGQSTYSTVRLNPDGSHDAGFSRLNYIVYVTDMALQPDGKIIVASPGSNSYLKRFNANGNFDTTFEVQQINQNSPNRISKIKLQADGKIIIAGSFTEYDGTPATRLARLNNNGSIDNSFDAGTGISLNQNVYSILLQPQGKIVIAGDFYSYNGAGRNRIARIFSSGSLGLDTPEIRTNKVIAYKNNEALRVDSMTGDITSVQIYDLLGKLIITHSDINASSTEIERLITNSIYILKIRLSDNTEVTKKIYY